MYKYIYLILLLFFSEAWADEPATESADCKRFCARMELDCPDVFLGNEATCLWACSVLADPESVLASCALPEVLIDVADVPQKTEQPVENQKEEIFDPDAVSLDEEPEIAAELRKDSTAIPQGYGAVFLPSITKPEEAPLVAVFSGKKTVAEGLTGRRILLEPGQYTVRFGSGINEQQPTMKVRIDAGRTTVVPPVWSALEVSVVDPQFVPFRGTYELIDAQSREVIGLGFGADALLGETVRPWILKPGLYKLVQSGGTYRDRTDFVTVRLLPGKLTRFVLVKDPNTDVFGGGGETDDELDGGKGLWSLSGVVGGDFAFSRTEVTGQQEGWTLALSLFLDGSAQLNADPHLWTTRLEFEEGQSRPAGQERFINQTDRLYLNSIYIYRLVSWFGPYLRLGAETKLLKRYAELSKPQDVQELDEDGNVVKMHKNVDRVKLGGAFAPTELKESVGGNFRIFRSREGELDLRAGVGAWQDLTNGLLNYDSELDTLTPIKSNSSLGIELSALGQARITRFVTVSSEFEGLAPFDDFSTPLLTWRSQISLRLASFASFVYRYNLIRSSTSGGEFESSQDVQLRFSYTLF